jgi:hypothetical protein
MVRDEARGQHHADVALPEQQRALSFQAGLRAALSVDLEAERRAVVERGLARVPDVQLDVVDS